MAVANVGKIVVGHQNSAPIVPDALIEPYADGPEIDASLVMWQGDLLFCAISGDFPSSADGPDATMGDSFQETMLVFPSMLPPHEQDVIRHSLHWLLLQMGYFPGVFHVEAREQNSSMHYIPRPDGLIELVYVSPAPDQNPSVFLIEVNPRPPRYTGSITASNAYGVDFFVLWALEPLGDEARFRALCCPFLWGLRYTSALVIIEPDRGGRLISEDLAIFLRRSRLDLMENVPLYREVYSRGGENPDPKGPDMSYIIYIKVISRVSREELLQTVWEIGKV